MFRIFIIAVACMCHTVVGQVAFSFCGRPVTNQLYDVAVSQIWGLSSADIRYPGWVWTQQTNSSKVYRNRIAMTPDGSTIISASRETGVSSQLGISPDYGITWGSVGLSSYQGWWGVAISANGYAISGASNNRQEPVQLSDDFGTTWRTLTSVGNLSNARSVTISSDGLNLVAGFGAYDYATAISTNRGVSWTAGYGGVPTSFTFDFMACSASGRRLITASSPSINGGHHYPVYTSNNYGDTWSATGTNALDWRGVAISGDGSNMVAVAKTNGIWISHNSGLTWSGTSGFTNGAFDVAMSYDGSKIIAGFNSYVYASSDGGVTWTNHYFFGMDFCSVAISSNGSFAVVGQGYPGAANNVWTGVFQ